MDDNQIQYFATNQTLPTCLSNILKPQGYKLVDYQIGDAIGSSIFILFSPVWCNEHFISCDKSWKKYFQKELPDIRFITAGFKEAAQDNYIDLLNVPTDFRAFFSNAQKANEEWIAIDTEGLDMEAKLQRFYIGHGNDSVQQIFASIITTMRIINKELSDGNTLKLVREEYPGFSTFTESWSIFRNRFSNYYPFLKCLPFFGLFKEIYNLTELIEPFFRDDCQDEVLFKHLPIRQKIEQIHRLLKLGNQYVE